MAHIILELVRDRNGRVVNVVPLNDLEIQPVPQGQGHGFFQIVDGKPVQFFASDEIVIAKVRE